MKSYKELNDKFIDFQEKLSENIKKYVVTGFFITVYVVMSVLMFCAIFKINVAQFFN